MLPFLLDEHGAQRIGCRRARLPRLFAFPGLLQWRVLRHQLRRSAVPSGCRLHERPMRSHLLPGGELSTRLPLRRGRLPADVLRLDAVFCRSGLL
jgi:hypothetical protein